MGLLGVSSWTGAIDRYASQIGLTSQFTLGLGLSVAALAAGVSLYWLNGSDGKKPSRHGPGPKGVPIFGSAGDLPTGDQPWVNYMQWAKKYGACGPLSIYIMPMQCVGDFIYMTVLGQPTYLISSFKTANELMDKRAMIYSDRPVMVMAQEL
jgi:hypothetical protein